MEGGKGEKYGKDERELHSRPESEKNRFDAMQLQSQFQLQCTNLFAAPAEPIVEVTNPAPLQDFYQWRGHDKLQGDLLQLPKKVVDLFWSVAWPPQQ
jgi:hypothetical protein